MDDFVQRMLALRVGGRYQLGALLGSGTFGKVYQGVDVDTGQEVAMKLEHNSVNPSSLAEEVSIYQSLVTKPGFPKVFWHGEQGDYNIMVFDLLGPNLEDLLCYCGGRFSLKTTLMLADQLLIRFKVLHTQGYLHRDVKPENFLLGCGKQGNVVYMTDLGLATLQPEDQPQQSTEPDTTGKPGRLLGTCRYASINGHFNGGRSYSDDLESLGYMLVYFLKGRLPWQGLPADRQESKYDQVRAIKQATSPEELCEGLPAAFSAYMTRVRSLHGLGVPDYRQLQRMFQSLYRKEGFQYDNVYDWTVLEYERQFLKSEGD